MGNPYKHGVTKLFSWLWEQVKSLGIAVFLVLAVRSSVIEAFKIPSGSMVPTLLVGDYIFVNKFAYGWKAPFWDWATGETLAISEPMVPLRGDVIVFKYPKDESLHYIKRVVGLPGDRISVKNKIIFINDKALLQSSVEKPAEIVASLEGREYDKTSLRLFHEEISEDRGRHYVMVDNNRHFFTNTETLTVPADRLFVMGDNRDYSADSRVWGFVPLKNIRGKAMFIWFSLWLDFSKSDFYFHPERMGTVIH